jgi:hypothetical protein
MRSAMGGRLEVLAGVVERVELRLELSRELQRGHRLTRRKRRLASGLGGARQEEAHRERRTSSPTAHGGMIVERRRD